MIRTNVVELTVIPAVAYRQKLPSGGSGITILRYGEKQPGIASISTRSGKAIPAANTPLKLYPEEAFDEAIRLTTGLPYKKQGSVVLKKKKAEEVKEKKEEEPVAVDMADYDAIAAKYTDKTGKLSYDLFNKDLIRFAKTSSVVREMIAERVTVGRVRKYIAGVKFRNITGNHDLTDKQVKALSDMLDNVHPAGLYKDLNDYLRRELSKQKK